MGSRGTQTNGKDGVLAKVNVEEESLCLPDAHPSHTLHLPPEVLVVWQKVCMGVMELDSVDMCSFTAMCSLTLLVVNGCYGDSRLGHSPVRTMRG